MTQGISWRAALGVGLGLVLFGILAWTGHRPGRPPNELPPAAAATDPPPPAAELPLVAIDHGGADPGGKHHNKQGIVDLTEASVNPRIALALREKPGECQEDAPEALASA